MLKVFPVTEYPLGSWAPELGITIRKFSKRAEKMEATKDLVYHRGCHESIANGPLTTMAPLYEFTGAAVTKDQKLGGLNKA